jgi:hypothetical protein
MAPAEPELENRDFVDQTRPLPVIGSAFAGKVEGEAFWHGNKLPIK